MKTFGIYYQLGLRITDGLESSSPNWYTTGNTSTSITRAQAYSIAPGAVVSAKYNQWADENISGTNTNQIFDKVRAILQYDSEITSIERAYYTYNGQEIALSVQDGAVVATETTPGHIDVQIVNPTSITGSDVVPITIVFGTNTEGYTKSATIEDLTATKRVTLSNLQLGITTIKPFTEVVNSKFSCVNPFGIKPDTSNESWVNKLKEYNFSTASYFPFLIKLNYNGLNWSLDADNCALDYTNSDTDTLYFNVLQNATVGSIYDLPNNPLSLDFNSSSSVGVELQFVNLFDYASSVNTTSANIQQTLVLNFKESPTINFAVSPCVHRLADAQNKDVEYPINTCSTDRPADMMNYIRESMRLHFKFNIQDYNSDTYTIQTYIARLDKTGSPASTDWELFYNDVVTMMQHSTTSTTYQTP